MLSYEDVLAARERVETVAVRTPLNRSFSFSEMTGADVRLKLENTQRTGAFKIRGAMNRIAALTDEERERGVVTASAGNHAQGVALAATRAGVDSTIVMPKYAPVSKVEATRRYGAEVVLHGIDYDEAQARAHEIEREQNRVYLHAFEDELVMAGQGTIGLEIAEQCPEVDTVVVPIGGGGLISGVATALKGALDDVRVVGVQAAGADSAARSMRAGHRVELDGVDTVADGIAVREVGEHTFPYIRERVDQVVTVDDEEIAEALTLLLERSKTVVEGAGAVALAAVLEERFDYDDDEVIVPALCGGNIDMNTLITVILRGLVRMGRYLKISLELKDRPGELERVAGVIAREDANVYALSHDRTSRDIAVDAADLEIELETHGDEHAARVVAALEDVGYEVEVLA
ncbi:threonine ammonia-lyase [Halobaculum lipolyticum]|uniref:threonine ammonia-lyase n=1 Tax=Halobaculum lipolyticum TaxID=3032001 RepID=A0ABD5WA52_9EURY|nr:threonine ammonia-lyase [Halobaculum sp. DT31]